MTIDVRAINFVPPYAAVNTPPTPTGWFLVPVAMPELINRALTVGGYVTGSPAERTFRRTSISAMVRSAVRPASQADPSLVVTRLYQDTETSEKIGISFRLGMAFAAVVASRRLDVPKLLHFMPGAAGRRADLVGQDKAHAWHAVEAKSRSYGGAAAALADGKTQASITKVAKGAQTGSVSVAELWQHPIRVTLQDPPIEEGTDPIDEGKFWDDYYLPVRDLVTVHGAEPSGVPAIDESVTGAWLDRNVWFGMANRIFEVADTIRERRALAADLAEGASSVRENLDRRSDEVSVTDDGHVVVVRGGGGGSLGEAIPLEEPSPVPIRAVFVTDAWLR